MGKGSRGGEGLLLPARPICLLLPRVRSCLASPRAAPHLGTRGAEEAEVVIDQPNECQEMLILVVKSISEDYGADDIGDRAAKQERGVKGFCSIESKTAERLSSRLASELPPPAAHAGTSSQK